MKDLNITLSHLAQYVMQSENVIKDWIDGKCVLPYYSVFKLCDFLSIDPLDVFAKKK